MVDLQPGDKAPDFTLPSSNGGMVRLRDFKGKKRVVLYFYPKDNTTGCTTEACSFRDYSAQLADKDTVVFGVSADSLESHERFIKKFNLNFPLLADTDHRIAENYGAWGEKSMYGKKYFGMIRKTFIIGKNGKMEHVFHKVKPENHGKEVLALLS